jgi:hypothetical protein
VEEEEPQPAIAGAASAIRELASQGVRRRSIWAQPSRVGGCVK